MTKVEKEIDVSIALLIGKADPENIEHIDTLEKNDENKIIKTWKIEGNIYTEVYEKTSTRITLP